MPDQAPNQDSDDSSILDSDTSENEGSLDQDGTSPVDSTEPEVSSNDVETTDTTASEDTRDVEALHFEDEDLGEKLRHAREEQLDNASFGIIKVDDEGIVEFFNRYESELSDLSPEEVKGRNFFTQVAPCTNNRLFRGRFKKGVRRGDLDETFSYTYTYKMNPTLVDVHLYRDKNQNNWILAQKY